jgi:hypothetical protein
MKQLIEDYKRRLKTVNEMLESEKDSNGSINDVKRFERLHTKASEFRTIIAELERVLREGIPTSEVFCIQTWYGQSIDRVYLDKEIAEKQAVEDKARWRQYRREVLKDLNDEEFEKYFKSESSHMAYRVQDLDDAIHDIKEDAIIDERNSE